MATASGHGSSEDGE
eukprot:Cvel_1876.t1-p1 / transcript=Cvel_1876.t1 / gene=Cvel_1876 / organism=Chromera_velia_CCMP2878 / gene_product=hypothetical protein / transcript_product=hypothetical protein / location=Cvel_scaffold70:3914-3956(-) / protein_length=14 / sequence_SO=supercontig / SO=protein_coding / is_pseudo=false